MEEFVAIVKEGGRFPEKSVLITFDDGYRGIYERALPELAKRGMKATFFITADSLDKDKGAYPCVTKEQLKKMAASPLVSIGSHTCTHATCRQKCDWKKAYRIGGRLWKKHSQSQYPGVTS